jgi:hypothetical protein
MHSVSYARASEGTVGIVIAFSFLPASKQPVPVPSAIKIWSFPKKFGRFQFGLAEDTHIHTSREKQQLTTDTQQRWHWQRKQTTEEKRGARTLSDSHMRPVLLSDHHCSVLVSCILDPPFHLSQLDKTGSGYLLCWARQRLVLAFERQCHAQTHPDPSSGQR